MTLKQIAENYGLTPEGVVYALRQYQIVMTEITHGMLSKLSYDAHDVLRYAQERWCDTCDLKAEQESKVMTPEEAKSIKSFERVWLEIRFLESIYHVKILQFNKSPAFEQIDRPIGASWKDYQSSWRLWTNEPTDEQREAAKWN